MKQNPLKIRKKSEPCPICKGQGNDNILTICLDCYGSGKKYIVCRECWNKKSPLEFFDSKRNKFLKTCKQCREKYRYREKTDPRNGLPDRGPIRVKFNLNSNNTKTGSIPVSMTSSLTCPSSCSFRGGVCYSEGHFVGMHWRRLSKPDGSGGIIWDKFCEMVSQLPKGQVWRHNEAGDLPGLGDEINASMLKKLIIANMGKAGFTYTHKPVLEDCGISVFNRVCIYESNTKGFCINLSANDLEQADTLYKLGIGPVVVTLTEDAPKELSTPKVKDVIVCPSQYSEVTCKECKLCAKPKRQVIIGFRAHGLGKNKIGSNHQLSLF